MKKIATFVFILCALTISVPAHALSPSVKVDMLKTQLVDQLKAKEYSDALKTMQELKETGAKLPPSLEYFEGKALFESGQQAASYDKFAHYAETQGKNSKYYKEAIAYLVKAEEPRKAALPWKHMFGGSENDAAYAIVQTADGGFALAGYTWSKGAGKSDAWVIRLDAQGKALWERTFGGGENDFANAIVQTADGGFALAGSTWSKRELWVVRLDAQGKLLWDRAIAGSQADDPNDEASAIVQTADGGFVLTGHVGAYRLNGKGSAWISTYAKVIRLDALGEVLWDRTFTDEDRADAVVQTADGRVVVAGATFSKGAGKGDAWIACLDAQGKVLWEQIFGGSGTDGVNTIVQTAGGGFAVAGFTWRSKGAGRDAWVVRLDDQGKLLWDRTFGGSENDYANAIVQTADGGLALANTTWSKGAGGKDAWFLRLNRDGELDRDGKLD